MLKFLKKGDFLKTSFVIMLSVMFVTFSVSAATTISTNIETAGTLTVSGTGATTLGGALTVTGLSTFLGGATTTSLILRNGETITNNTDGIIQLGAAGTIASTTSITLLNGETITNATDGTISFGAANLLTTGNLALATASSTSLVTLASLGITPGGGVDTVAAGSLLVGPLLASSVVITPATTITGKATLGYASTTGVSVSDAFYTQTASTTGLVQVDSLKINGGSPGRQVNGLVFGYCNMSAAATIAATSSAVITCTEDTTSFVTPSHRIFVMATSSLPVNFAVLSASSTGAGTIGINIKNSGNNGDANYTTSFGPYSFNFLGIR